MDSHEPPAGSAAASEAKPRRKLLVMVIAGAVVILAGFIVQQVLTQRTNNLVFDPTPKPRPRLNAPFITSADSVVDAMVKVANVTDEDVVYDLGCGDGRIVVTAAVLTGCRGIGFDIDPERVAEAQANVELHDVKELVTIQERDVFTVDMSEASVAMFYLLPWMIQRLTSQFEEMKPGSRIVSHDFYIEDVEPDRVVEVEVGPQKRRHAVYLYTVPLRWNPDMPKKPPTQGVLDREEAARAAAEASSGEPRQEEARPAREARNSSDANRATAETDSEPESASQGSPPQ